MHSRSRKDIIFVSCESLIIKASIKIARMENRLRPDLDELSAILADAELGWWKVDFYNKVCFLSGFIAELLGVESGEIGLDDFFYRVREDYRANITNEFMSIEFQDVYDQTFPLYTKNGFIWVHSRLCRKVPAGKSGFIASGIIQCVPDLEEGDINKTFFQRINHLLFQNNNLSTTSSHAFRTENTALVVDKILNDILTRMSVSRVCLFEFDSQKKRRDCLYEVVNEGILSEMGALRNLPLNPASWWGRQLLSNKPILLSGLDEIPGDARSDREILETHGIKSLMAVPMMSRDGVWGYMRVDCVESHRKWSNEDYQWFASMANITNICLELKRSEFEAQQDRLYLDNLYRHMPVGYIRMKLIFDDKGCPVDYLFVDINEMADKILGVRKCIGKLGSLFDTWLEYSIGNIKKLLEKGSFLELNFRIEDKDKYCHSILYSPKEGEMVCLFSDMTDTFKAHEALDRSEKMLRNIYNNLPIGIELYDTNGNLIDFNDKNLEILGVEDKAEIMHLNLFGSERFSEEIRKKLRDGKKLDFSYNYEYSKQNWHNHSRENGMANLITKMTPIYDSQNKISNYLVVNIDNTETTSAYRKIQEFEEYFSVIADFAKVGYFKWNPITDKGFAINQWFKNVGEPDHKTLKEIVGVYRNYHPDDRMDMNEFVQQGLLGQVHDLSREVRVKQPDGSWRWLRCNIMVKEFDPGHDVVELVGVNYDITELKEVEEKLIIARDKAEALDRLKSAFIANMSHEIRTPLNAIVGFSNLLIDTEDADEKKQYIEIVQKNNDLLVQLISDILDLSKMEAGTFEFIKDKVDVKQLCEDVVYSFGIKSGKQVEIILGDQLPECCIYSDRNRLTQIISNFMTNALKFTEQGSITVDYCLTADGSEVEFSVTDTGIGIPKEKQEVIFRRFVKLDSFVHGTGLGLPICKSIAEQLGGRIGVESEVGVGSRFWFTHQL